jgi:hypothetical protein
MTGARLVVRHPGDVTATRPLKGRAGWGAGGPILGGELDTPEVRAGREEFDADARALIGSVSQIDNAAFLLFFCDRIDQDKVGAQFDGLLKVEEATMSVDDNGLTVLAELAAVGIFPCRTDGDAREDPRTAALS